VTLIVKERQSGAVIASGDENQTAREFEGNWYFTPEAVNMSWLTVTERTYICPYKGTCFWIDLETPSGFGAQNVAWVYRQPKPGYEFIQDQIGFYTRSTMGTTTERQ